MGWVRDDFTFDIRSCVVLIGRNSTNYWPIVEAMRQIDHQRNEKSAEMLEMMLRGVIYASEPRLKECTIRAMSYDISADCWKVLISHAKLPTCGPGHEYPRVSLERVGESLVT